MYEFGIAGWHYHQPILREKTMTLLELPGVVQGLGLDILELCSTFFANQTASYLLELRTAIDDSGLRIANIAVDGPNLALVDETARMVHLESIMQWFHVAHAVGATAIRVNSGGSPDAGEDELTKIADGYRALAEYGAREGIPVLIENHGGASTAPTNIARLLEMVDSPWFGTCPDSGNFVDGTWRDGISAMAPRARTTHLKVSSYSNDGWQDAVGQDGIDRSADLRAFLEILTRSGYDGPLCIEQGVGDEDLNSSALGAVDYVKRILSTL